MLQEDVHSTEYQFSKKQIAWGLVVIFSVYATVAFLIICTIPEKYMTSEE